MIHLKIISNTQRYSGFSRQQDKLLDRPKSSRQKQSGLRWEGHSDQLTALLPLPTNACGYVSRQPGVANDLEEDGSVRGLEALHGVGDDDIIPHRQAPLQQLPVLRSECLCRPCNCISMTRFPDVVHAPHGQDASLYQFCHGCEELRHIQMARVIRRLLVEHFWRPFHIVLIRVLEKPSLRCSQLNKTISYIVNHEFAK